MSTILHECLSLSESGTVRVDRAKGTIGPVKALGWKSANGREYLKSGVSASLYEGKRVCVGHVKNGAERSPLDTYGLLEGIRVEATGVYADRLRLLNPGGDFEQRLLTAAETAPHLFGLSHTARGREKSGSGGRIIEAVESVESVDLVSDPATVAGLYESKRGKPMKTLNEWCAELEGSRPLYVRALREMAEAGIMSPDDTMEPPADAPAEEEGGDHEAALKAGFRSAIIACLDDEDMDLAAKLKRIKEILKTEEKLMGGGKEETPEEEPTEESRKRRADASLLSENARLQSQLRVRSAADAAGVRVPKTLLENLAGGITDAQAKTIVGELKGTQTTTGQRPRSAAPKAPKQGTGSATVHESTDERPPSDTRQLGRWLNGR